jgi:hypothetical protein
MSTDRQAADAGDRIRHLPTCQKKVAKMRYLTVQTLFLGCFSSNGPILPNTITQQNDTHPRIVANVETIEETASSGVFRPPIRMVV